MTGGTPTIQSSWTDWYWNNGDDWGSLMTWLFQPLQGSALLELLWLEWISQPIFMACGCVWKRGIPMKIFTLMRNTVIQHQNLLGFHWIFRQTHGLPFLGPRSKWAAPQIMHDFRYVQILKITSHECLSRLDPKFENWILDKAIRYCWLMLVVSPYPVSHSTYPHV